MCKRIIFSLVTFFCLPATYAQEDRLALKANVIQQIIKAHHTYDPLQYSAQMRFKGFETDTFEIRNCSLSYRSNEDNMLYGYDWKMEEADPRGFSLTIMMIPEGFYMVYEDDHQKNIAHRELPQQIQVGAYHETMRYYFLLDLNIAPFVEAPIEKISLKDSSHYYVLSINTSDESTSKLVISKDTYLPVQSTTVMRNAALDLRQILEINFFYDDYVSTLPDSVFSADYYQKLGYAYKLVVEEAEEEMPKVEITADFQNQLLNYPFLNDQNDTSYIHELNAEYILLDFWFASCYPCLEAMPVLGKLADKYAGDGLLIVGINCFNKGDRAYLTTKFKAKQIDFPLLFGERTLVNDLGMTSFPTYLLIMPDRRMVYLYGSVSDIKPIIDQLFER